MIALMIIWHIKTPKITTHLVMKLFYEQFAFQLDIIVLFCKTNLRLGFASKWVGSSIHCWSSIWRNAFTGVRDIITPVCGVPNSTAMKLLTNKRLTLNNRKYSTKFSTILFFYQYSDCNVNIIAKQFSQYMVQSKCFLTPILADLPFKVGPCSPLGPSSATVMFR